MTFSVANAAHNQSSQESEWIGRNMYMCGKLAKNEDVSKVRIHLFDENF